MSTREKIVEAAEHLFAVDGYDGTSLRDITERAGVNVAAVNYHFGSKEGLLVHLLDRVVVPINEERLRALDQAESSGRPSVPEILTAFLLPDLNALRSLRARNPNLPRFVARMYTDSTPLMEEVIGRQFEEVGRRFGTSLADALPELDEREIGFRLSCLVGIVVYMFAGVHNPRKAPLASGEPKSDLARLLNVATALMTAPTEEVPID